MTTGVLIDYTTLVSATNVLNCNRAEYPLSTVNPYQALLEGRPTERTSPMWLEVASLADVIESIVLHDELRVIDVSELDRIQEIGRYQRYGSESEQAPFLIRLSEAGILRPIPLTESRSGAFRLWIHEAADGGQLLPTLLNSLFEVLQQPVYEAIPDLFSHSQTVYKFDGETVWNEIQNSSLNRQEFRREFIQASHRHGFAPKLRYTQFLYLEEILSFFVRGLFYNDVAKAEQIPYHPHPARSALVLSDALWSIGASEDYAHIPIQFVSNLRDEVAKIQNQSQGAELFDLSLPPVFAAVLKESSSPGDVLEVALQMRQSQSARAYREWVASTYGHRVGREIVLAERDLAELRKNWLLELGFNSTNDVGLSLWGISFTTKIPSWLYKPIYLGGKSHLQFIRDLAKASLDVMRLEHELLRLFSSV